MMLKTLLGLLTDEQILQPVIALLLAYMARSYDKGRKTQVAAGIVCDLVDYIEEHYRSWGIRGSQKMDRFLELFKQEFKKAVGRYPTTVELETARIQAEAQVQRSRRK